jgi:hypothetical protein
MTFMRISSLLRISYHGYHSFLADEGLGVQEAGLNLGEDLIVHNLGREVLHKVLDLAQQLKSAAHKKMPN